MVWSMYTQHMVVQKAETQIFPYLFFLSAEIQSFFLFIFFKFEDLKGLDIKTIGDR